MVKSYRPRDIARLGLIKNSTGGNNVDSNYIYILRLIKAGKIRAKNYGTGKRPYWLVSASEVERFNTGVNN